MNTSLRVELGARSYDIVIGGSLIRNADVYIAPVLAEKRVVIVTDDMVAPLYLETLETALTRAGIVCSHIILPHGEETKRYAALEQLLDALLDFSPDRNTTLIALGGGVVGDITGFAASILLRGVGVIQIPTTLLAQVDSSVGGKTGINTRHGKNLIGTFYQPRLVLADISALATLPKRELLAGYAEVVKYGVINDAAFFRWLEENGGKALQGDVAALTYIVQKSCAAKARIVGQDERESGARALLNFGHTLGHAFETETGYSDMLLHGEAVALGMVFAMRLSQARGLCGLEDRERVEAHLSTAGLRVHPRDVAATFSAPRLIDHCYHDKKAFAGGLTFILAKKIGETFISHDVTRKELEALLAVWL